MSLTRNQIAAAKEAVEKKVAVQNDELASLRSNLKVCFVLLVKICFFF
jgi:hypothetical protein